MKFINLQKARMIFGSLIIITLLLNINLFAKEYKLIMKKHFNISSGELLELKTDAGDIILNTWDKEEIAIEILGNKNAEKKFEFTFDKTDFGLRVIGERKGSNFLSWFKKIRLKYEIMIPKNFNLKLKTAGGDIVLNDCEGEFDMKTSGGDIEIKNSLGELNCSTSGGDINIEDFDGDCDVSTSGGDITIEFVDGNVFASTSGGNINISSESGKVKAATSGGDIDVNYRGNNYGISLATSGGDINLTLPSNFSADVELKTTGGEIYNNFSHSAGNKITKRKFIGTYNSGGEDIVCKTSGGDITVSEK
jgi:DUF4097 and DUF4098 domain-containing protein YvlB